ncbi:peroxisome assembly protein 22 [Scheffersomyces xylosifermentans]|uniref:peroxisome assembly protein 22 n=1 Tax=Scheffersomyces xylosifermentans TaxID=1304137 RepID=UPI00315D96AE
MPAPKVKMTTRAGKFWLAAVIATSVVTISYKIYERYVSERDHVVTVDDGADRKFRISKKYLNKSIALTLSHSILNSKLPLNEILINGENIIFILPPNLSEDDLTSNLKYSHVGIIPNFKLLKCSNIQGYVQILKNLKPDMLLLCSDDLGLSFMNLSKDLNNFIKTIVNLDQSDDDIDLKVRPIFS